MMITYMEKLDKIWVIFVYGIILLTIATSVLMVRFPF